MTYTKQQIANLMDSKIRFEIEVDDDYSINYEKKQLTFIELERISKQNLDIWKSIEHEEIPIDITNSWNDINSKINEIRGHFSKIEEFNLDEIKSFIYQQYLNNFTENMEKWEEEKENKLRELEETYKNKLQLEEPEKLWNLRAENYRKKAKFWTYFLVGASIMLALIFSMLVWFLYEFPLDISKKIPFLSQSFFVVAIISFFIYIIRILVKLSMSNNHLAIEYEQKAAMTRFFQALTYDGESINENERLIIINSLFNKVDTGLVKTDGVEMENMLAILAKNLK
ncbi:DUF6161 domain-containing protein [Streptococcus downei]|uniref:DUF6161 domain-containing protein n=1 Tax=Streptococcus downei MFe28 TaxID=764290 RepID=A0A380JET2_STRDO|nr:DUF6161 domain-containing protein [Streptococcus downei]SUN36583.1 Uncharacterised protein [Streptococcus downei MFe28]